MNVRPIRIIGGGLAGLSLGIALRRRGVPVTVFEAGNYPRHRVCGEFVSGIGEAELAALGIAGDFQSALSHRSTAWFVGDEMAGAPELPVPALAISRYVLDAALARRFCGVGGELRCHERATVPNPDEGWVMATGRQKGRRRWLGLKAHYRGLPLRAGLEMHLGRGGYAGLTELADGTVNVCALLPWETQSNSRREALPVRLDSIGLKALSSRLRAATLNDASLIAVTHFTLGWQSSGGAFSVGDHLAMIAPFTGNGMSMAFRAALVTAPLLTRWSEGHVSWEQFQAGARDALRGEYSRRLRWARVVHPFLFSRGAQTVLRSLLAMRAVPFEWLFRRLR